jgi:hypothetical protein
MKILGQVPTDQDFNPGPTEYIAQVVRYLHFTFTFLYFSSRCKSTIVVEVYKKINHLLVIYTCLPTTSTIVLPTFYKQLHSFYSHHVCSDN